MKLSDWRTRQKLSLADLARLLGVTGANPSRTVQRFETGERTPSFDIALRIVEATGGEVTLSDLHHQRLAYIARNAPGESGEEPAEAAQ